MSLLQQALYCHLSFNESVFSLALLPLCFLSKAEGKSAKLNLPFSLTSIFFSLSSNLGKKEIVCVGGRGEKIAILNI